MSQRYSIEQGWQRVLPYETTLKTFVKGRWINKTLQQVFQSEFKAVDWYKEQVLKGRLLVNDAMVSWDYMLKDGDVIQHVMHKHEPPVTHDKIVIVDQDQDTLYISKPGSWPVILLI